MGIMLISALGVALGIVFIIIGMKKYNDLDMAGILITTIYVFAFLICLIIIVVNQTTAELQCGKLQERKNAIEYRLEQIDTNDQNIMINGGIYDDIVEYNNDVRKYKTFRHSFWTNWFVSKGLDEFDYIEYDIEKTGERKVIDNE